MKCNLTHLWIADFKLYFKCAFKYPLTIASMAELYCSNALNIKELKN